MTGKGRGRALTGGAIAFVLLSVAAVTLPSVGAGAPSPVGTSFSNYDTGSIHVVLPTAVPTIRLSQDADGTVASTLSLDRVLELRTSGHDASTGPAIAAVAFPNALQSYNTSSPGGGLSLVLTAQLTVYRTSGVLFPSASVNGPTPTLTPISPTTLSVTVVSDADSNRVDVQTQVTGWPWVSETDLLALSWVFSVPGAVGYAGCVGTVPTAIPSKACEGTPFSTGSSSWNVSLGGLEGLGANGPIAQLAWNASAAVDGTHQSLSVGESTTSAGSAVAVFGTTGLGSAPLTFGISYALVVPPLAPVTLHGTLLPFLGGAVGAAVLGASGVLAYRRRERSLLDAI
jgi:hypothetical protein